MNTVKKIITKDVLIIGSGLAGLYTALRIKNADVLVVTKTSIDKNNSMLAQGGIAATLSDDDSFESHVNDTLRAGSYINDTASVAQLVENAPEEIDKLINIGVEFDKDDQGNILTTLEGGHSAHRVLHANGDATGRIIMEAVQAYSLKKENIDILENTSIIKIIKREDSICGAIAISDNEGLVGIVAKKVVIATGGLGAIYENTTNPPISTGDGIALAHEVGAKLRDLCFVQFHPTSLYEEKEGNRFLITEALRGEGAKLLNINHQQFMARYDERKELAPRDVVSQAINEEMKLTKSNHVYLDITHLEEDFLSKRFPTIYETLLSKGINMSTDYIPVAPVAHYLVGGILTDLDGKTDISNLYACGEVASSGVHGANRLASNSLLECLVFGHKIARDINETVETIDFCNCSVKTALMTEAKNSIATHYYSETLKRHKHALKNIMTKYVGIVRKQSELASALSEVQSLRAELTELYTHHPKYYELYHMMITASLIIEDAINKKESIGCHYIVKE